MNEGKIWAIAFIIFFFEIGACFKKSGLKTVCCVKQTKLDELALNFKS